MLGQAAFQAATAGRLCVAPHKSTNESGAPVLGLIRGDVRETTGWSVISKFNDWVDLQLEAPSAPIR
jgi:hypothetical protein